MDLTIESSSIKGIPVLILSGECDVYTAPKLKSKLIDVIDEGNRNIVIDCRGIEFMDSSGLGVLVGSLKRIQGLGGGMIAVIAKQKSKVEQIFRVTGLGKVFNVVIVGDDPELFTLNEQTIDRVLAGKK